MMSPLKPAYRSFSPAPAQPARDVSGEAGYLYSGRVIDRKDKFNPGQKPFSAWQGPPNVSRRLRYFQAEHQLAD